MINYGCEEAYAIDSMDRYCDMRIDWLTPVVM